MRFQSAMTVSALLGRALAAQDSSEKYAALPGYFQLYPQEGAGDVTAPPAADPARFVHAQSWEELFASVPSDAKLLILHRHAEGFHNAAERRYGKEAWDDYWSKLDGDEHGIWADAQLTPKGQQQASAASEQVGALVRALGVPERLYSSPLRRCLETFIEAWAPVAQHISEPAIDLHVREGLRETLGVHTCDRRVPHSQAVAVYQGHRLANSTLQLHYEAYYPEPDMLWSPTHRETTEEIHDRVTKALDRILDRPERYIFVTAHSEMMVAALHALHHPKVHHVPNAGFLYLVVGHIQTPTQASV
ncbi:AaceriAEL304Cp [[Ashbya] aceris (nom. inval.)]|nr:AaceriAEL304Cp [[Ashbya] aceris (nom. inval.)]